MNKYALNKYYVLFEHLNCSVWYTIKIRNFAIVMLIIVKQKQSRYRNVW